MGPAQKIRIVEALQPQGQMVAMDRGGTNVAREAASMVLLNDNFATLVTAVREGRRIYNNIRKFVRYAMTGNSGKIWALFLAPLLLLHILWANLVVTDRLPGLSLAAELAERDIMQRPPRAPNGSLFAHGMRQHILGICPGAAALVGVAMELKKRWRLP